MLFNVCIFKKNNEEFIEIDGRVYKLYDGLISTKDLTSYYGKDVNKWLRSAAMTEWLNAYYKYPESEFLFLVDLSKLLASAQFKLRSTSNSLI